MAETLSDLGVEVQSAMADVLPSADPLDATDFDAVAYLNMRFPSERALKVELDSLIKEVSAQIGTLDDEISAAVHAQAEAGARAARDIGDARTAMTELAGKIGAIKAKAEESESIVREICRDIKSLDSAKRNLQTTMTALKRTQMLTAAVAQLRASSRNKKYGEAANLLEAVGHLLVYFEPYGDVPRVSELKAEVAATRKRLEDEVFDAFQKVGRLAETSTSDARDFDLPFESVADACMVVDAVGPEARERQISALCTAQLEAYGALFPKGGAHSSLEDVDRRFSWIRRLLRAFQDRFKESFPAHWQLERRLVDLFVQQTRAMFLEVLSSGLLEHQNVTTILRALQKSLVFEKEVQARFDDLDAKRSSAVDGATTTTRKNTAPSFIESPHTTTKDGGSSAQTTPKSTTTKEDPNTPPPVIGSLSSVFDPFMQPYVDLEKKNMEDMMSKVAAEEDVDRDGALPVFSSSVHVFAYIKTSVRRCTALTTGQTFYKLYKAFGACLREYAARLKTAVEDSSVGTSANQSFWASQDAVSVACYALNTAEYCAETVEQLCDIVRSKIDASYREQVDGSVEAEAFRDVVAAAVKKLVAVVDAGLEPLMKRVATFNWAALDTVDEESSYVGDIVFLLRDKIPAARALLSPLYLKNTCDKVAASLLPKYYAAILQAKRLNETATHQLLLDLHSLKPLLLDLPNIAPNDESSKNGSSKKNSSSPQNDDDKPAGTASDTTSNTTAARIKPAVTFTKFVTKHTAKIEMVLKLAGTPTEMLVERFKIMWPDGSRADLLAVAALKGLKKQDQLALADTFSGGFQDQSPLDSAQASAALFDPPGGSADAPSAFDRAALESKLESVSTTASLTINKAASQMRDLMQRGVGAPASS